MGSIGLEDEELIVPGAIPMPGVAAEELRSTAKSLKNDGQDTADIGQAIRRTWHLLQGFYRAPESNQLLIATDPVADSGEEIGDDLATVASALSDFADDAERIEKWLKQVKADVEEFVADVGENWQINPLKMGENLRLKSSVNKAVAAYQEAERECANKITNLFDGPTSVPDDGGTVEDGQLTYGMAKDAPDTQVGVLDVWGAWRGADKPWWGDVLEAQMDMGARSASSIGSGPIDAHWACTRRLSAPLTRSGDRSRVGAQVVPIRWPCRVSRARFEGRIHVQPHDRSPDLLGALTGGRRCAQVLRSRDRGHRGRDPVWAHRGDGAEAHGELCDASDSAIAAAEQGSVPKARDVKAAAVDAVTPSAELETVTASEIADSGGVIVECVEDCGHLCVRVASPGFDPTWHVQFPKDIRSPGARYLVAEVVESSRGGFYRVRGDIRRLA
ncbi:hypothetical protein NORO109296_05160 [Nocardiopsis rhodophaea]